MFRNVALMIILAGLLLAACTTPGGSQPTELPLPTATESPTAAPTNTPAMTPTHSLDEPVTAEPGDVATPAPQPWDPQPGDKSLERSVVHMEGAAVLVLESFPVQIMLTLSGSLPTPCHQLRVAVAAPDAQNQIAVEVYSLADPTRSCTQNLAPFEVNVPMGSFASGDYIILVNGELAGKFTA